MNEQIRVLVRACVETGDPTFADIRAYVSPHGFSEEEIEQTVKEMVVRLELHMKDDDFVHDWLYRRGARWNEFPKAGKRHIKLCSHAQGYDEERRLVWGYVSASDIKDLQGDIIEVDEFKKMYDRAIEKYNAGELTIDGNHSIKDVCDIHETSKQFVADTVRWYVCVKVKNDETWEEGKAKGFHGFSIGGWWERIWDETRKAFILKNIDLDEFSLLYGSWDEEGLRPVMPANQLANVIGVKSMDQLKDKNFLTQLWADLLKRAGLNTNQGDLDMNEEKVKELIAAALADYQKNNPQKKEITAEEQSAIVEALKPVVQQMIEEAMKPKDPPAAGDGEGKAVKELTDKVTAMAKTIEDQSKKIDDLLQRSAQSQHQRGSGDGGKKPEAKSAVGAYADSLKGKLK